VPPAEWPAVADLPAAPDAALAPPFVAGELPLAPALSDAPAAPAAFESCAAPEVPPLSRVPALAA